MSSYTPNRRIPRREFLKLSSAAGLCGLAPAGSAADSPRVCLITDVDNSAATSVPVKRAITQLSKALERRGAHLQIIQTVKETAGASCVLVLANAGTPAADGFPAGKVLTAAESLRMTPGKVGGVPAVLVSAADARGFAYALLELAERVRYETEPVKALQLEKLVEERPANEVRSVSRYFCSELEDKTWFYDREFWTGYLDQLVASRFNRFTLALGLEYDFPRGVTDDYFHFAYPYLVDVPEYPQVRVMQIAAADGTRLASPVQLS